MEIININEYIYYYYMNDEEALAFLIRYFKPVVHNMIHAVGFECSGQEEYDLYSVSNLVLIHCLDSYREDLSVQFITYFKKVLKNKLIDYLRKEYRSPLYVSYSPLQLDSKVSEESRYQIVDVFNPKKDIETEEYVYSKFTVEDIRKTIEKELKPIDCEIFDLLEIGYKTSEIARILDCNYSKVMYHLKKIQKCLLSIDKE